MYYKQINGVDNFKAVQKITAIFIIIIGETYIQCVGKIQSMLILQQKVHIFTTINKLYSVPSFCKYTLCFSSSRVPDDVKNLLQKYCMCFSFPEQIDALILSKSPRKSSLCGILCFDQRERNAFVKVKYRSVLYVVLLQGAASFL